jgi:hypothetical protein
MRREALGLAPRGAGGDSGLAGAKHGAATKEDDRAQQLIGCLFRRGDQQAELIPFLGRWMRGARR